MIEMTSLELSECFLIQFPKLKVLSVTFKNLLGDSSNVDLFWQSVQQLSNLEYLEMHEGIQITSEQLSSLCFALTKLRYFLYFSHDFRLFGSQFYLRLFLKYPSLRMVIHRNSKSLFAIYLKDIITHSVHHLNNVGPGFIYKGIPQKYLNY